MLSKQSIRKNVIIYLNNELIELQFVRTDLRIRNSKGEFEPLTIKPTSLSDFDF